jgi:two-component system, OmpR family, KDP operon response regulator KdpE
VTRVLVVDDERQIVRALRASLGAHGYDVESVGTGEEALAVAASAAPDLMILDLGLPDMDGVQVIKALRSWSQTPVIVLSVREAQQDKVAALDAGADDFGSADR